MKFTKEQLMGDAGGGLTGDVHSITDKLLSQKIQIFLNKVKPFKFYYIDNSTLYVGFDESHTTDAAENFYKEATSSKEFFDSDSVSMEQDTYDTIYSIKLKKEVRYAPESNDLPRQIKI